MNKSKSSIKKSTAPRKPAHPAKPSAAPKRRVASPVSEDYEEYLERYELYGEDRPRLSPAEFNRLDDELLDLLAEAEEGALNDEQTIRLRELEFLLLDEQSDSSSF